MNSLLEGIFFQEGGGISRIRSGEVTPENRDKSPTQLEKERLEKERLAKASQQGGRRRSRRRRGRGRGKRTRGRRH